MAIEPNGALKAPKKNVSSSSKALVKNSPGLPARFVSISARLLTWYCIFTVLFRCPADLAACDDAAPRICKPYFRVKEVVQPRLQPYYNAYGAPYVATVKPYYDALDQSVLTPSWHYAVKYGAPRAAQAQALGYAQWQQTVRPQLARAQDAAVAQYEKVLGPYVETATTAIGPYYDIARTSALQTHYDVLLPTYELVYPYAQQGYTAASAFTTSTVVPSALWAWDKLSDFVEGTVWPHLRALYTETVEPQLVKIGRRLGQYTAPGFRETVPSSAKNAAPSSFTKPPSSVPTSVASSTSSATLAAASSSSLAATASVSASTTPAAVTSATASITAPAILKNNNHAPVPPPDAPDPDENEVRRNARETVAEDLKAWQEKYAKAADEGAVEIDKRVEEISRRMIRRQVRTTGKALLEDLQQTVTTELTKLRAQILDIVGEAAEASDSTEATATADERIAQAIREAGLVIKPKAQQVRSWHAEYDQELQATVSQAAQNHFQILGSIRDLALQKIGMKWAWMEGVTYKDWAKYHLLKSRFDEWESDLEELIVTHPTLNEAQAAAQALEDEAMGLALSAVEELKRLKEVAAWKLAAKDTSDEFDSDIVKAAAEAAAAAAVEAARAAEAAETAATEGEATETETAETAATEGEATETETAEAKAEATGTETLAEADVETAVSEPVETVAEVVAEEDEPVEVPPAVEAETEMETETEVETETDADVEAAEPEAEPEAESVEITEASVAETEADVAETVVPETESPPEPEAAEPEFTLEPESVEAESTPEAAPELSTAVEDEATATTASSSETPATSHSKDEL